MRIVVAADAEAAARRGAACVARRAAQAVRARGRFALALSGGQTPLPMLRWLALASIDWSRG
ncbi:MAG: 6-phosphogluconolactonase, partial [Burkholderiaceae bacterium]